MSTLVFTVWWTGIFLEALVVVRLFHSRSVSRYGFFFAYISCVLLTAIGRYTFRALDPRGYTPFYWTTEFVSVIVGYGVIFEILRHTLSQYPGVKRLAEILGFVMFGLIFCFAVVHMYMIPDWTPSGTIMDFERNLRAVQAMFLFGVLAMSLYYGIAVGRSLKGIALGYGLYIGMSVINFSLLSYLGVRFTAVCEVLQSSSYMTSLVIWSVALWQYYPNPTPDSGIQLEADYAVFVSRTRRMLGTMRSHLIRSVRP